jgi:hypothetical protein
MRLGQYLRKIKRILSLLADLPCQIEDLQQGIARLEYRQLSGSASLNLQDYEFKATSQNGEDGIIQFLIDQIQPAHKTFVEFGVHKYTESNTRFLLKHNLWSGLVIDGSQKNIDYIKADPIYWRYNLKAECAFINKDNINTLILKNGLQGEIGLLSVDIDGNDYWVWDAIICVNPAIVICEYNALYGPSARVSIPYTENFIYDQAHYSTLYWGASIGAFNYLAEQKGYALVGANTMGNNIFFVRNDLLGRLPKLSPEQAYVQAGFRTSRDPQGNLTFLDHAASFQLIADMPLCEVDTGKLVTLRELSQRQLINV